MAVTEASEQANRAGMDPRRLVVIFYMVFGIVLALFLAQVLSMILARAGVADAEVIEGLGWQISTLLGVMISAGALIGAWMHPVSKQLSMEVASELMKVTWPSWGETRVATFAVVVASAVAAIILFGIDTIAYKLMVHWLPQLWGKL
jgi:preprotein translocase subunit SecE